MSVDLVVVGLGYVGLPLAQAACGAGLSVRGLDLRSDTAQPRWWPRSWGSAWSYPSDCAPPTQGPARRP